MDRVERRMIPGLWTDPGGAAAAKYKTPGESSGGLTRTGQWSEWCRNGDGLGGCGYRARGEDGVGDKSFGRGFRWGGCVGV